MEVNVKHLIKNFDAFEGRVQAVDELSFDVKEGEFYTLLGPSGCGKSTTLRCIAGLERIDGGEISIGGKKVVSARVFIPPNERPVGMVFQSYAIWPHMTVFRNVAFPLKQQRIKRSQIEQRVMEALETVQMAELAHRPAPFLSGGQQQRVALARALVSRPQLLLLDEPLSNLDAKLREDLRLEIKDLVRKVGITTLYVTHDQAEALSMSDRIAVMYQGRLLQEATPKDLYFKPTHSFVAQFIGQVNFFEGTVEKVTGDDLSSVSTNHGNFLCLIPTSMAKGTKVLVAVRPESFVISKRQEHPGANTLSGEVVKLVFLGDFLDCQIRVGDQVIRAKLSPASHMSEGEQVSLTFEPDKSVVIPYDSDILP